VPLFAVNAALPANLSWVKYSGNPVVPSGTCGLAQPARPAVVVESTDNYKMYFTDHPGTNGAQIYLATTSDGGLSWTCANSGSPVLTLGSSGAWDDTRVVTPAVVKDDASDYKMWYTGRNASAAFAIGYATSTDGVIWTKYGSNPVLTVGAAGSWESSIVREPSVVNVSGTYHMWYSGTSKWPYFSIGHATSSDGKSWTKDTANPILTPSAGSWDSNEVYAPSVVMNGSDFEMFYSGNTGGLWVTGHATSNNGTSWTKDGTPFLTPSVSDWDNSDSTDYVAGVLDGSTWKVFYSGAGAGGYQIGLITLTDQAQLTFNKLSSSVGVGNTVVVYIDVMDVTSLYGYQFEVNYNASKVSASGAFVNSFFDTTGNWIPGGWNAVCSAGVCKFAVSKVLGSAVSGSGTLAQITFSGVSAGLVPVTFSNNILSDRDGGAITHTTTVGYIDVYGSATISGVVTMQGRATPKDVGTVTLNEMYGYAPPVVVNFSAADGTWTATVPVYSGSSTYDLLAAHGLYLSNQKTGVVVSSGGSYPQPTTKLLGGDADNSSIINIADLSCIGGAFGGPPTACGTTGSSDINADGSVNILDLVLAGGNYDKSSPQPW
jgi:predicted GH43/DUF377 family glycosyl hydrolase